MPVTFFHYREQFIHQPAFGESFKNQWIDLDMLMDQLGKMGMTSLLIEGGSRVFTSALSSGIVDKIIFFFGPKILGGDEGYPIFRPLSGVNSADRSYNIKNSFYSKLLMISLLILLS